MVGTATTAMLLLAATGCQEPTGPGGGSRPITELPRTLTVGERDLIGASNRFGFSLLDELSGAEPDENLFYSPLSAHMALGMALSGARDSTYEAMATTLGFAEGGALPAVDEIHASYESLAQLLLRNRSSANACFEPPGCWSQATSRASAAPPRSAAGAKKGYR